MTSTVDVADASLGASEAATCRAWVLRALELLEQTEGRDAFSLAEIVTQVVGMGAPYTVATIRANIVSSMCVEARANRTVYADLERARRGYYRRLRFGG
jgi:hypothetical protein